MITSDLFESQHVTGALYFTSQGHYILKYKERNSWRTHAEEGHTITKSIREPEVAAAFSHVGADSGYLPEGVIRVGNNSKGAWFVFIRKPAKCKIEINGVGKLTIPAPLLVLVGAERHFYLFALQKNSFAPDATAYQAPFPNVNSTGWICWGTENIKPKVNPSKAGQVMDFFFKTPFNDDLKNGKSKAFDQDIKKQLVLTKGMDQYPVKDLVSMQRSIGAVINELVKDRS